MRCFFFNLVSLMACLQFFPMKVHGAVTLPPWEELHQEALFESAVPVRPGNLEQPFWNIHARRFIYAPAFDFPETEGAVAYRFSLFDAAGAVHQFRAMSPQASLAPVWSRVAVGYVTLFINPVGADGKDIGKSEKRVFYRAAVMPGTPSHRACGYRESAQKALAYLFHLEHIQNWLKTGRPDPEYDHYCYPSKIIGSGVIRSMVMYARLSLENREAALLIARKAADFLLSISEGAEAPLPFLPPTYYGGKLMAGNYAGQLMMLYPAEAAMAYLDLYDAVGDKRYLDAAMAIAGTYRKLQLPQGTWYLKVQMATGEPLTENLCVPLPMIWLFQRLERQYGMEGCQEAARKALAYICNSCLKTYNWESQYEDSAVTKPYVNLTLHNAIEFGLYILREFPRDVRKVAMAEELFRYAEDQFLVWEKPMPNKQTHSDQWICPCGLEQYYCYVPIDTSATRFIQCFLAAYKATGKTLYLAKAMRIADATTRVQCADGRYPTYWENNERLNLPGWINCASMDAEIVLELADYLDLTNP